MAWASWPGEAQKVAFLQGFSACPYLAVRKFLPRGKWVSIPAAPCRKRGRLRLETALAHWGEPGRHLQAVRLARWIGEQGSFASTRRSIPNVGRHSSVLSPTPWSPRRSRLDSEVGASALAEGSIQLPLLRPLSHEPGGVKEKRGEEPQGRAPSLPRCCTPSAGGHQLPARVTDRDSLALASHGHSSRPFGFTQ